jgi:hypothetical protein
MSDVMYDHRGAPVGTRIRHGGLMRCCLMSIHNRVSSAYDGEGYDLRVGDRVSCEWCSSGAVIAPDGVWEWDRLAEVQGR